MFVQEAIRMLKEMYFRGGIEVCTPLDEKSETGLPLGVWTLIQPDGDVINKISNEAVSQPEVWIRHNEKLEEKVAILRRFRILLKLGPASSLPAILFAGYSILSSPEKTFSTVWPYAAVFLAGFLLFLLRPLVSIMLRWHMRKLSKFG